MAGCAARVPPGSEARLSLATFLLGASVLALPLLTRAGLQGRTGLALYVAGLNALLLLLYRPPRYQVRVGCGGTGTVIGDGRAGRVNRDRGQIAIRACFLGFVFGCGVLLSFSQSSWNHFGWYVCSLSLFHYSEYLVTAVNNPKSLSLDSFLLNHSLEYTVAALSSWIEFTLENIFWPELKQITWLSTTGLLMVVFGECLRKAAMFTAGSNFNHVVQSEKSDTHTLVTSGVYAWFRHPSYVGWFYWSIGTQVMLCNPICGVVYALTVWRFFRDRTEEEEISLIHFFGEEYLEYKKRVPTGLPFIKGVKVEL
ncbi:protein-S-isoprenylcysteine O-methyltransferase isoform X1 [Arvicola amphibius]|nr:protein-S-isoprenylcysteine O-methyltransferase isoform X1 [Arvicola amphibius]